MNRICRIGTVSLYTLLPCNRWEWTAICAWRLERDGHSWNLLLAAYFRHILFTETLKLHDWMEHTTKKNWETYVPELTQGLHKEVVFGEAKNSTLARRKLDGTWEGWTLEGCTYEDKTSEGWTFMTNGVAEHRGDSLSYIMFFFFLSTCTRFFCFFLDRACLPHGRSLQRRSICLCMKIRIFTSGGLWHHSSCTGTAEAVALGVHIFFYLNNPNKAVDILLYYWGTYAHALC